MPRRERPFSVVEGNPDLPRWQEDLHRITNRLRKLRWKGAERAHSREQFSQLRRGEHGAATPLGPLETKGYQQLVDLARGTLTDYAAACFLLEALQEEGGDRSRPPSQWPLLEDSAQAEEAYGGMTPADPLAEAEAYEAKDLDRRFIPFALQRRYGPPPLYLRFLNYLARAVASQDAALQRRVKDLAWRVPQDIEGVLMQWVRVFSSLEKERWPLAPEQYSALRKELEDVRLIAYQTLTFFLSELGESLQASSLFGRLWQTLVGRNPRVVETLGRLHALLSETENFWREREEGGGSRGAENGDFPGGLPDVPSR